MLPTTTLTTEIRAIYETLGPDTLLVPPPPGQPPFAITSAQPPTIGESLAAAHQLLLAERGAAAALGGGSGRLCALTFADPRLADEFVAANPVLTTTCRLICPRLTVLLVRVIGAMPSSRASGCLAWLAGGSLLTLHLRGGWTAFAGGKPGNSPVHIKLDQLDWQPLGGFGLALLRDVLRDGSGTPLLRPHGARSRLNRPFWVAFLARILPLRFHAGRRQFQHRPTDGLRWVDTASATVAKLVGDTVSTLTAEWGGRHHATPWECDRIVAGLRQAVAKDIPDERVFFRACVGAALERHDNGDVSTTEALAAIQILHRQHGYTMPSTVLSQRWLRRCVGEIFGIPRSNNCERKHGERTHWGRGYQRLRIRTPLGDVDAVDAVDTSSGDKSAPQKESGSPAA